MRLNIMLLLVFSMKRKHFILIKLHNKIMYYLITSDNAKVSMELWQVIVKLRFYLYCIQNAMLSQLVSQKQRPYVTVKRDSYGYKSYDGQRHVPIHMKLTCDWGNSGQVWTCEYLNVKVTQFSEYDHIEFNSLSFPTTTDNCYNTYYMISIIRNNINIYYI